MKKVFLLFFVFIFQISLLFSQEIEWVLQQESENTSTFTDVIANDAEDIFGTGNMTFDVYIDGNTLAWSGGTQDVFLVRLSPNGEFVWGEILACTGTASVYDVKLDGNGNVLIVGYFTEELSIQGETVTTTGNAGGFIASFDADGNLNWLKGYGDTGGIILYEMVITSEQEIVAVGQLQGNGEIEGQTVESAGSIDALLVNLNVSDASFNWLQYFGSDGLDRFSAIDVDSEGNLIVVGAFSNTVSIGSDDLVSQNGSDPLFVKTNSNGTPIWAKSAGSAEDIANGRGVVVDNEDNIYISGLFSDLLDYEDNFLYGFGGEKYDPFLISIDPDGGLRWMQGAQTEGNAFSGKLEIFGDQLLTANALNDGLNYDGSDLPNFSGNGAAFLWFDLSGNLTNSMFYDGDQTDGAGLLTKVGDDFLMPLFFDNYIEVDGNSYTSFNGIDGLLIRYAPEMTISTEELYFEDLATAWYAGDHTLEVQLHSTKVDWISVYTTDGKLLYQQAAEAYMQIGLPDIPDALLLVQLTSEDEVATKIIPAIH
ncbi:MAG: hypothetical protein GYB31_16585 [Bacteroidetes bacterium]|nr:hypothetical protein [Bacteroidota bacterium]